MAHAFYSFIETALPIPIPSFLGLSGTGMLYQQIFHSSILLMHSRITLTTLVVLCFSFLLVFPGLHGEFDCCVLVLCIEVAHVLNNKDKNECVCLLLKSGLT